MKYNPRVVIAYWESAGIPRPFTEYPYASPRKFRADFAWPEYRVLLECEGGVWSGGAHGRGSGIIRDMARANHAAINGWRVLRFTPQQLCTAETVAVIRQALRLPTSEMRLIQE